MKVGLRRQPIALQLGELWDALVEAGASPDLARKAAEEAAYGVQFAAIDSRLAVLTWITVTNVALTIAVLFKAFH